MLSIMSWLYDVRNELDGDKLERKVSLWSVQGKTEAGNRNGNCFIYQERPWQECKLISNSLHTSDQLPYSKDNSTVPNKRFGTSTTLWMAPYTQIP